MVEVAVIHIGASYTEHLEHFQALHAFRRRKEHVVGACVVSCTAFLSLLFCLRRAPPSAGYIRLRRRFSRCRISPGIKKSGLFEPGNAKCIKKRRREREVGGGKGGSLTPTDKKRYALFNASLHQQAADRAVGWDRGRHVTGVGLVHLTLHGNVCLLVPS